MSDGFDRAPGAGRGQGRGRGRGSGGGGPEGVGFRGGGGGGSGSGTAEPGERPRPQQPPPPEPLRPPKTSPPPGALPELPAAPDRSSPGGPPAEHPKPTRAPPSSQDKISPRTTAMAKPQVVVAPVLMSKLSVNAPEFYPSGYTSNFTDSSYEDGCDGYPTLTEYVQEFLNHLTEQPGSFETEIDQFAETLKGWVTTDDALLDLVELIYQQATTVPHFSYMGARLCNYLSHHLTISPQSGNFRQLLLKRCRTEYENKDQAAKGDEATRKRFHSFVLFLGELYLNLEIKGTKGQVTRADILQVGLRELLNALFSNPVDNNLICAVKLLKLTGSVLEDAWKEKGKTDMDEVIQRIENVVLDANCSRDVKQMLLKLVELRSSNWGRVHATSTYREATPENDPNYFMNEPTFYTSDGIPFTAADPDYQEKYQELLDREIFFPDYEENGTDLSGAGDPYVSFVADIFFYKTSLYGRAFLKYSITLMKSFFLDEFVVKKLDVEGPYILIT
ncbi:polyadenylate-binding protein-interacting protein 1 isoform X1 [Sarcophilus harrisii]|uniref:polyadenylate-binding protein-interacting protein 1 isoform X1 n=2 Tax=Sarcophilus harrisii TaxID=9305 RepID=UPI001301B050|nr:polyadenylate-binding protein-interacting protein 1 isoform X1 [Sarcophilus harrisii]